MSAPIRFAWDGEAMTPVNNAWAVRADKQFTVGEDYSLIVHEERSQASHNQYFASVHEAFLNLPEDIGGQFLSEDHLRKYCLIKAGYCDERSIVCASKAEAQRVAAFIRPIDTYAIVVVSEATIKVFTAQSQSMKAMGKAAFQASKEQVLDILAGMVDVSTKTLTENAGKAA